MPIPSAMIKGTVIGPVVTPPESNATAKNDFGINTEKMKVNTYKAKSTYLRGILNSILSIAIIRNIPTPAATVIIITAFGIDGTCVARTDRSGSAMVIINPIKKHIGRIMPNLPILVICSPAPSPKGSIDMSAPNVKNPIPTINSAAPAINNTSVPIGIGETVMLNISTITVIGNTDESDSLIFPFKFLFIYSLLS